MKPQFIIYTIRDRKYYYVFEFEKKKRKGKYWFSDRSPQLHFTPYDTTRKSFRDFLSMSGVGDREVKKVKEEEAVLMPEFDGYFFKG